MTDGDGRIDREALAREVIVSAAGVLRAAGFARDEIAGFFEQAAEQLGGAGERAAADPLAGVARGFAQSGSVAELLRLAGEGATMLPLGDDVPALKAAFDLAMRIVPQLGEAQATLKALAGEAGLPVVASEAQAGDHAGPVVCLERFAGAYGGAIEVLGAVTDALVARGDGEAFAYLLNHMGENGVVIAGPLQARLEKGLGLLG